MKKLVDGIHRFQLGVFGEQKTCSPVCPRDKSLTRSKGSIGRIL
jgi:hypothetical protein